MAETAPRHESNAPMRTVLVVEGEFMIRVLLADYLQECGFKVLVANDAAQAISIIEQSGVQIDVVFSDVSIPGNGFGLARWIRENRPNLPVLLGSGDHHKTDLAKELCENGPLLRRPYDLKAVVARVRTILSAMKL